MTELLNYFKIDPTLRIMTIFIAGFLLFIILPQYYYFMNDAGKAIMDMRLLILGIIILALVLAIAERDMEKRS